MITLFMTSRVKGNPDSNIGVFLDSLEKCGGNESNCEVLIKYYSDDDEQQGGSRPRKGVRMRQGGAERVQVEAPRQTEQKGHAGEHDHRGDGSEKNVHERGLVGESFPSQVHDHDGRGNRYHFQGQVNHE